LGSRERLQQTGVNQKRAATKAGGKNYLGCEGTSDFSGGPGGGGGCNGVKLEEEGNYWGGSERIDPGDTTGRSDDLLGGRGCRRIKVCRQRTRKTCMWSKPSQRKREGG